MAVIPAILLVPVDAKGVDVTLLGPAQSQLGARRVAGSIKVHLFAPEAGRALNGLVDETAGGDRPVLAASRDLHRRGLNAQEVPDHRGKVRHSAARLTAGDRGQRVLLLLVCTVIDDQSDVPPSFAHVPGS